MNPFEHNDFGPFRADDPYSQRIKPLRIRPAAPEAAQPYQQAPIPQDRTFDALNAEGAARLAQSQAQTSSLVDGLSRNHSDLSQMMANALKKPRGVLPEQAPAPVETAISKPVVW